MPRSPSRGARILRRIERLSPTPPGFARPRTELLLAKMRSSPASPSLSAAVADDALGALLRSLPEAVTVLDPEGRVLLWSAGAERVLGWDADEVTGGRDPSVPEDRVAELRRILDGTLAGDPVRDLPASRTTRKGRELPVRLTTARLGPEEDPSGVLVVARPGPSPEELTEELRRSEIRFRHLFQQTADALLLHTPDGSRILEVNREACESLGYSREELLALSIPDVVEEPGPKDKTRRVKTLPVGEKVEGIHSRHRRKDGSRIPVEVQLVALEWEGERAILASCRDVGERREMEERLRETAELLEAFVREAPVAIMVTDRNGRLRLWNPGAEEIFGWRAEEVLGEAIPVIPEEERTDFEERMGTVWGGLELRGVEVERVRKDGERIDVQVWVSPLRAEDGTITGSIAIAEDVTERRSLEERLRLAERLKAVGRLAAGVAHDFNNNLTTILSLVELILMDLEEGHPARADVKAVRDSARASARLTQQLLAYGRQQVLQPRVVQLCDGIRRLEPILRGSLPEGVELSVETDDAAPRVLMDPGQLEQVLVNLVLNAGEATPSGGRVVVECGPDPDDRDGQARLVVRDEGAGIPPEIQERIFEPFFTTKPPGEGTGLGLATVYGIVEQSEGTIEVDSVPGEGTTIRIRFPARKGGAEGPAGEDGPG